MDFTYLDYFNYYLKEFCNEITANFPDFEKSVVENYRPLLESKQCKTDIYVKCFVSKVNNYMEPICARDTGLFDPARYIDKETGLVSGLFFVEGVDFLKLWASSHNTSDNQRAIWKYLQLLTLIGRRIVPNKAEVLELLGSVDGQVNAPAKVEKTLLSSGDDLNDAGNKPDMLGGLSSLAGLLGGGNVGGLASLAGSLLGGGDGGLGDMIKSVGDMFGGLDLNNIAEEFKKAQEVGESTAETLTSTENATASGDSGASTAEPSSQQTTGNSAGTTDGANNLFVDMAQEMANTFDFSQLEGDDAQPANMGEAFKKLMGGDNPKKIMGLISKFGSKIQNELATGKLNHADLLKQTSQMMSGMGNPDELKKQAEKLMKGNPDLAAQAEQMRKQQQRANAGGMTKDRLRAKLEAKRQAEEGGNGSK
jgi:hypothetical protein